MSAGIANGLAGTKRLGERRFDFFAIAPRESGEHANGVGRPRPNL